ncbi:serine/threonine protein phosphatase 2A 55 kDa regulatory subunit B beta isoform-like isoform X2 [Malus sylvestris]|nr:serine/threonine protein phosphatase 2A 55 kDa regulatory subunit B beta isoform-like isoform X2 [Malus sylvestris]
MDYSISGHPEFRYKTEFQSHKIEFDYYKNKAIEETINKIRWCQTANGALFLLSTNDKTIKYWKVTSQETSLVARCRRLYANAHDYYINSISNNSGGETFISADDLRINLWNLEISNQSFNIVDVKPANMEDLTELITSAEFHPTHCNMLAYSSSKGSIRLIDLRQSALCDTHSKLFEEQEVLGSRSFFTDLLASISDMKFAKNGRHILSRDYMTLKLWDINMDSGPVATFQVHEHLRPKLCDLYKNDYFENDSFENDSCENDSIFDKFECCLSGDGHRVATGSYSNLFRVFGCSEGSTEATTLEASKNPLRRQVQTLARPSRSLGNLRRVLRRGMCFHCNIKGADNSGADADNSGADANGNSFDFTTKLLHLAWHPSEDLIACAASNSLYMYYA